jgi:3-oxoacyl-(acyl-carrier-protein) synthase
MGEGGAVLVLETIESAIDRGVTPIAELIGYGATADAYHITQPAPEGEGGARAMKIALKDAGIAPNDVDYINAHGTSTLLNDKNETTAMKTVFGDHALAVPISSTKSMTGHLLGASGSLEAAVSAMVIERGEVPPTMNLDVKDPDCDLDYTPHVSRRLTVDTAMTNSFGFGGHNSSLLFGKFQNGAI